MSHEISPPAKRNLMIVDDAPTNLRFLAEILMPEYEVSVATNGPDALEIIASESNPLIPELILLDIVMPDMDGYEVCRQLQKSPRTRDIPVVFVTASTDDETLKKAFEAGGTDYVRKPVNRIELLARIKSALTHQDLVRQVIEEERLKGVLEMAGAVCHEMNQPMQNVLGFSQLLMNKLSEDDPRYEYFKIIIEQMERMGEITKKLMRITRYETVNYVKDTKIIDIHKASEL